MLDMHKEVVKRHTDPVCHRHLDIPWQAQVVQFHVRCGQLSCEARKVIVCDRVSELTEQDTSAIAHLRVQ